MKHLLIIFLGLCALSCSANAHEHDTAGAATATAASPESAIKIVNVTPNLHMLINPNGGNITVSTGEDGAFIIDDNLDGQTESVRAAVRSIKDQDINFILNTHYHFDHTGGNVALKQSDKNALILAHDNVREHLSTDQFITYFKKEMKALPKSGLPVVTFGEGMNVHFNGDRIQIKHLPAAHTDGDSIAHFLNENVIVAGDVIFNNMYPFIDAEHGGSFHGLLSAQKKILDLADDDTKIIPGHGPLMTKAELMNYHTTLEIIGQRIQKLIDEGKTLEETLAAKPSEEYDTTLGGGIIPPEAFVSFLYTHLKSFSPKSE